ncbi:hypothetical protein [Bradyrhizobium sp.]|nr:hypothetical protein [Bradyrhizobium sp.]
MKMILDMDDCEQRQNAEQEGTRAYLNVVLFKLTICHAPPGKPAR